ncbi:MAG TPA: hypothetical protein VFK02_10840 [Kofleriaceae bacterium]|nr:hypothetical protein [Kofleriaceae bacterium]
MIRALGLAAGLAIACGPRTGPNGPGVSSNDAILYVQSNVRDAQLWIDGRFIAPLDAVRGGIAVEPGRHRLELRREDYFSSYLELVLVRAERRKIALDLAAILP